MALIACPECGKEVSSLPTTNGVPQIAPGGELARFAWALWWVAGSLEIPSGEFAVVNDRGQKFQSAGE